MDFIDWADIEVELIVADYFSMLIDELRGIAINKTLHRKALMPLLNGRSHGSVEFKHQNISAVLIEMGLPFIKGYKPRYNFQRAKLIAKVESFVKSHRNLEIHFSDFAADDTQLSAKISFETWLTTPPEIKDNSLKSYHIKRPVKINYLEREQNNRALGLKGEELVIEYEKFSLIKAGKDALAQKVEWVSKEIGDGLGFDILSKNLNGTDKYVEVKTTKLSKETPFFFSVNEYNFSLANAADFYLYRIFDFKDFPQMFMLNGRYDQFCRMEPTHFKGRF